MPADVLNNNSTISKEEEADRSEKLRAAKNGGEDGKNKESAEEEGAGSRWRELKNKMNLKKRAAEAAKKKITEKAGNPSVESTAAALRTAWWSCLADFGFSIYAIDVIVFLGAVLGKEMICPLGHEWEPVRAMAKIDAKKAEEMGEKIALFEKFAFWFLNIIWGCIILAALGLLVMIADFAIAPWYDKVWRIVGGLTGLSWGAVKALYDLVSSAF